MGNQFESLYPQSVEKSALKAHWAELRLGSGPLIHVKGRATARLDRSTRKRLSPDAPYSVLFGTCMAQMDERAST